MYILKTEDFIPVTAEEMAEYIGKDYEEEIEKCVNIAK